MDSFTMDGSFNDRERIRELDKRIAELEAELAEWRDEDSPRRQALMEEITLALGDGARSEIELRESQLTAAEAELARVRAECDRRGRVIEDADILIPVAPLSARWRLSAFAPDGAVRWGEPEGQG